MSRFLFIPRYLYYFSEIIKDKSFFENGFLSLNRSKLFELFIYRKLDKDRLKTWDISGNSILKRVLEKLALIMKIHQVSEISKDELMTVFDEMDSNFSQVIFRRDLEKRIFDRSLLKDNIDTVEFENQEFLDFLAAKELSRFANPDNAFFDLAMEPNFKEVYPSWFEVIPFLLEQYPAMVTILLDFMEKKSSSVVRSQYFNAITCVEPSLLSKEIRIRIFNTVFDYFAEHKRWLFSLHDNMAVRLAGFYSEPEHYDKIMSSLVDQPGNQENALFVRQSNGMELINSLAAMKMLNGIQLAEWKNLALQWLKFESNDELVSTILYSSNFISQIGYSWLKSIQFVFEKGGKLQNAYARSCSKISPEDPFSIDIYFKSNESLDLIFKLKTPDGIAYALEKWNETEHKEKKYSPVSEKLKFKGDDVLHKFKKALLQAWNSGIFERVRSLILILLEKQYIDNRSQRFLKLFIDSAFEKENNFIFNFVTDVIHSKQIKSYYFRSVFSEFAFKFIGESNFNQIHRDITARDQDYKWIFVDLHFSSDAAPSIKKQIFKMYSKEIAERENIEKKLTQKADEDRTKGLTQLCQRWENFLQPEPGYYSTNCFFFFVQNKDKLNSCDTYEKNRQRTINLGKEIVENYNPLTGKLKKTKSGVSITGRPEFRACIELLATENIFLSKDAVDNIFRYLPFMHEGYDLLFKIANNPSEKAVQDVLDVYSGKREDDLGVFQPENLLKAYKFYDLKGVELFLVKVFESSDANYWVRRDIIEILPEEYMGADKLFDYLEKEDKESGFYEILLCCLIKKYHDERAIKMGFDVLNASTGALEEKSASHMRMKGGPLIAETLVKTDYSTENDKMFLEKSIQAATAGKIETASFYQQLVARHLDYLKHKKSFKPLMEIETFVDENKNAPSINWFEYDLAKLKDTYLKHISKPEKIVSSVRAYNALKKKEYIPIPDASALLETVKKVVNVDLRRWIESEGAYKNINELARKKIKKNAEDFIQKTIKAQIELALLKRGFRDSDYKAFSIKREEQLLNDMRLDFTISYGFVGSVLLELKLSHNNEAKTGEIGKKYLKKLVSKYMEGTGADYGLFVIFNIRDSEEKFISQISRVRKLYAGEKKIMVIGLNCV